MIYDLPINWINVLFEICKVAFMMLLQSTFNTLI